MFHVAWKTPRLMVTRSQLEESLFHVVWKTPRLLVHSGKTGLRLAVLPLHLLLYTKLAACLAGKAKRTFTAF